MKKLSHLVVFLLLLCLNSKAQTKVLNDPRIAPLLKQAVAGQPELVISGGDNASRYVNMAVLDKSRKMLTWFTCYGSAFDSARLTDVEYNYIASKAVTPFDFYKQVCLENIAYLEDAESHFRQFGKRALKDTTHNRQVVYNAPSVKLALSTLQKVLAMESLLKKQYLQLTLFDSESPSHARRNDTFLLRKSLAGKMVRKGDTTAYYNRYLLGAAAKIALCRRAPGKMFVYNRQEQVIDSIPLKPEKYASLLKEKEDVFLLYRGWLELQSQQVLEARKEISDLLSAQNTSLFAQAKLQEDPKTLWYSMIQLEQQQLAIEQKISSLLMPDPQTVKSMLQDAYPDAPSEVSYLEGLGFAYTMSYTRGQKVYELTDHRGNVMATVSDKKKGIDENQDGVIEYYNADVVNANDYYPFGMLEPERHFSAGDKYRYGYNGKENDNEVKGEGNQQDYGMRIYDPRVGRFLSIDPLTRSYPMLTPYQFASNRPIDGVDIDGKEWGQSTSFNYNSLFSFTLKHTENILRIKVVNESKLLPGESVQRAMGQKFKEAVEEDYTNWHPPLLPPIDLTTTTVLLDFTPPKPEDGRMPQLRLFDGKSEIAKNGLSGQREFTAGETNGTIDGFDIKIAVTKDGIAIPSEELRRTMSHEAGHSAGLNHPWELTREEKAFFPELDQNGVLFKNKGMILGNLLNTDENPSSEYRNHNGDRTQLLRGQLEFINSNVSSSLWTGDELKKLYKESQEPSTRP